MTGKGLLWAVGAYLAGTFPATWLVAVAKGSRSLIAASERGSGEADPHILMVRHMGMAWSAFAAALDVLKALLFVLAARHLGNLSDRWLAVAGAAVVAGHTFPFYLRQMAGRGLATAAGVYLVLLPLEMTVAGVLIVAGRMARATGLAATVAMASVPAIAAIQGQPAPFVAMSSTVFVIIVLRRLEGVREVIGRGVSPGRAIMYRCLFDSSGPPTASAGR
jgi:acyl phosphate:glycerol-3-phosphate acyltransferase